ncbi:MAG: PaeR7I family type II restriction endonuclease [Candidatus Marinimicrobia bacterium]|nr:PaeR7I family type II restriction endonuclease [Candidatus Neomarinimicrobiota bacterium]
MNIAEICRNLDLRTRKAVALYWKTRTGQRSKQIESGKADYGFRGAVTGGAQMDGFIDLFTEIIVAGGVPEKYVFKKRAVELPGFFRPTKEWDLLVVRENTLLAAIEAKSQVGPSFGNNFNNRTEEALGSALDLWTAYRERVYLDNPQPFLGYFFMLEDCPSSNRPVSVKEPHFKVLPEFVGASYLRRYEVFCRKLVLERHYTAAAFITAKQVTGTQGRFTTPAKDLSVERFARTLAAHISSFA